LAVGAVPAAPVAGERLSPFLALCFLRACMHLFRSS